MMELTTHNVHAVLRDCLFDDGPSDEELKERAVIVNGIMNRWGFDPAKLQKHKQDIADMLYQLPEEFLDSKGGGMSFLNACVRRDGEQWGEHMTMDELFSLGQAVELVRLVVPRDLWSIFPGGMPYYAVKDPS